MTQTDTISKFDGGLTLVAYKHLSTGSAISSMEQSKQFIISRQNQWVDFNLRDIFIQSQLIEGLHHLPKLFEPFYTPKPVGEGIGIGLSTCYHIIQAHGGDINAHSRLGHGATFTVKLPRSHDDQRPT